jgi:TonB family protein
VRDAVRALGVIAILAGAVVMLADANVATHAPLSLGGIAIGASVLDAVKKFGLPVVVQTTDDGHFWQWAEAGGLDREVLTNDDLTVESVLVAPANATSTAQPAELPVLGEQIGKAKTDIATSDAVPSDDSGPTWNTFRWNGGVLVVETDGSTVVRLRALDSRTAALRGYLGTRPTVATHRAPVLVKQYEPAYVPAVNGTVIVRVEVDSNGKVTDARVIVPSGDKAIDRFEVASMRQSTFAPATCAGVPCPGVYIDIGWMSY